MAYGEKRGKTWRARYQRPDGSWGSEPGFPTRKKAEDYGNDQEAAMRAGTWVDPKLGETPLADWWNRWLPAQDLRPNTAKAYKQQWRCHIEPRWGSTPLAAIRGIDLQAWTKALRDEDGLSGSTINIITSALRGCFDAAVFNKLIGTSPMPPKQPGKRKSAANASRPGVVLPLPVVEQILKSLHADADRLLVLVTLFTGMRWSEVAAMRIRDLCLEPEADGLAASGYYRIDPTDGALHQDEHARPYLAAPKSGATAALARGYKPGRIIDLPSFLVLILIAYLEVLPKTPEGLLFPNRYGKPRRYESWNADRWRPVCDGRPAYVSPSGRSIREAQPAVWPGLHFHDLKHTHKAILNDLRVHEVMQDYRLGHVTPGTPGVYSHPTEQMRTELVDGLERFGQAWLSGGLPGAWPGWRAPRSSPVSLPPVRKTAAGDNALF